MQNLYGFITDDLYRNSGSIQLKQSYDKLATTITETPASSLLSRFNVDLTAVIQNYYQVLLDVSDQARLAYNLLVTKNVSDLPWETTLYDVTTFNPSVPAYNPDSPNSGWMGTQIYETDYLDPVQREAFFARAALNNSASVDWRDFAYLLNLTGVVNTSTSSQQLVYSSVFFLANQFSTSIPARNSWSENATASWTPFRPHFRNYNVAAITGPKIVSIILALSLDKNVDQVLIDLATVLINSLSSADRVTITIDDNSARYVFSCRGNTSDLTFAMVRAKPEAKPSLINFLSDFKKNSISSSKDSFNLTYAVQEQFSVACSTPSSQITIFYLRSTASRPRIPDPGQVNDIWELKPLTNRLLVINYITNQKVANSQNHSLVDLACRNSGLYVKAPANSNAKLDPEVLYQVTYDALLFMNAELQPQSALITVEKGWRQESPAMNNGLLWTLTVPVYLPFSVSSRSEGEIRIAQDLLGVVGIDFPPKVFADTLFRSVRWGLYAFVVDRQLDVLLHMSMDFFDWTIEHDLNPSAPYTLPISKYETIASYRSAFGFYYSRPSDIKLLESEISNNYFGHLPLLDLHRGYSWTTMPFFNLYGILVYRQDTPQESPVIRSQTLLTAGTLCQTSNTLLHYAVPFWNPSSPEYHLAMTRAVPPTSPLAIDQYRQASDGSLLPQRTWNISAGFFEVFGFSSPLPVQPFDLGRLSLAMISQNDADLVADPAFPSASAWVAQLNNFLSCRVNLNPAFTPSVLADVESSDFLFKFWSDYWLNATAAPASPVVPFLQAIFTQNGLYRFWPDNDGVSLAEHWVYNILDIAVLNTFEIFTLPFRKNGPTVTQVIFPVRSTLSGLLTPPTALTVSSFNYYAFQNHVFTNLFPGCAANGVRCYLVDSLLQVVLANVDVERYCSNNFAYELGRRSLATIERMPILSMYQHGLLSIDSSSVTLVRLNPGQIPPVSNPPYSFGWANCSSGQFYIWKTAGMPYFMISMFNTNMNIQGACNPSSLCQDYFNASIPSSSIDSSIFAEFSNCTLARDSGVLISCPSTDRSQQVLESLRQDQYKCFTGYNLETLTFTDPIAIVLYGVYALVSIIVICLTILFIKHRHTSVIESSNVIFVFTTLSGTLFASVSVFFWIGEPNDSICIARMWFSVCGFALISGMLFAKILYVYLNIDDPKVLRIKMPDYLLVLFASMAIAPQVLIVLIWTAYDPLKPDLSVADPNYSTLEQRPAQWVCTSDTSLGFYLAVYIIQGLLILVGAILTLTTRKTKSIWNESTWIGLVVYISAIIYPTVILLRQLLQGTPTQEFLILFVGVFIGVICVIAFIFCTKAWVILFRNSLNDTEARIADEINTDFQPRLDD